MKMFGIDCRRRIKCGGMGLAARVARAVLNGRIELRSFVFDRTAQTRPPHICPFELRFAKYSCLNTDEVRDGVPLDTKTYAIANSGQGALKPVPIGRLKIRTYTPVVNRFQENWRLRTKIRENAG